MSPRSTPVGASIEPFTMSSKREPCPSRPRKSPLLDPQESSKCISSRTCIPDQRAFTLCITDPATTARKAAPAEPPRAKSLPRRHGVARCWMNPTTGRGYTHTLPLLSRSGGAGGEIGTSPRVLLGVPKGDILLRERISPLFRSSATGAATPPAQSTGYFPQFF